MSGVQLSEDTDIQGLAGVCVCVLVSQPVKNKQWPRMRLLQKTRGPVCPKVKNYSRSRSQFTGPVFP